jgi:hypothetical protein
LNEPYRQNLTCNTCHSAPPGPGSNKTITPSAALQESQDFKVPQLRNLYKKTFFNDTPNAVSLDGFGFTHDGVDPTLFRFLSRQVFTNFRNDTTRKTNLNAFLMCFDTGVAPAVGFTRTVSAANVNDAALNADWSVLQSQAAAGGIDLIAKGTIDGKRHGLLYQPGANNYKTDKTGLGPFSQAQLKSKIAAGDILSITGVSPGSGTRMGIDRDLNGELDGDGPPFSNYSQWVSYWFTPAEANNPGISGATIDTDGDGISNLLEYALNLKPKLPQANSMPAAQLKDGAFTLTYTKILDATDIDYAIYQSTDLKTWQAATVTNEILTDDGRQQTIRASVPVSNATPAMFLQLRVTQH